MDNTEEGFFKDWTKEQLILECARLNRVLKEFKSIADKMADCAGIELDNQVDGKRGK